MSAHHINSTCGLNTQHVNKGTVLYSQEISDLKFSFCIKGDILGNALSSSQPTKFTLVYMNNDNMFNLL